MIREVSSRYFGSNGSFSAVLIFTRDQPKIMAMIENPVSVEQNKRLRNSLSLTGNDISFKNKGR